MKLADYREDIEKGERGEYQDSPGNKGATAAMFGTMAAEIRRAAWQPDFREEATELAGRAQAIADSLRRAN